jgi:hypothetical protein
VLPPEVSTPALETFDADVRNAVSAVFGPDISPHMAAHSAGLGIVPQAVAAPFLHDRFLRTALGQALPFEPRTLTQYIDSRVAPAVPSERARAQITSQTGFAASAWLRFSAEHFPPSRFIEAVRLRCLCPPTAQQFCHQCGANLYDHAVHPLSCKFNSAFTAVHRHNGVLGAMAARARSYGFTVITEPTIYATDADSRRPDILFCLGRRSVAVDLTIADPTCGEYLPEAAATPGAAAARAAARKQEKHSQSVKEQGHLFSAWAAEAFGHMDPAFVQSLRTLALELPGFLRKPFVSEMINDFAVQNQIGNAQILRAHTLNEQRSNRTWHA